MTGWGVHGAGGAFQAIVEDLMRTLLEDHPTLLGEREALDSYAANGDASFPGAHSLGVAR